ncbi:MAG: amidohydrolase, partial [Burkholderiales bacterium]
METVVYRARRILTMNPARPEVGHVAVRAGRIVAAGDAHETGVGRDGVRLDERFAGHVLLPGFVEGHAHAMEGVLWRHPYCGGFERTDPAGRRWPGARTRAQVVERLREAEAGLADPGAPLLGWGLDPLHVDGARLSRHDLDAVSRTRPVAVLHASLHIVNANTAALERAGLLRAGVDHPGIPLGDDGLPAGELRGPDAYTPLLTLIGVGRDALAGDADGLRAYGRLAVRTGVTTATDLVNAMSDTDLATMLAVTGEPAFPLRLVPAIRGNGRPVEDLIALAARVRERSTDALRLGAIKLVADGSIQGFTARLREPGYHDGSPQGLWYLAPEWMQGVYDAAMREGLQVHTHTNGDQATELAIDCTERALRRHPWPEHRFVLQHCQLADRAQLRRMARLGLCANFFSNHHFYWGDSHHARTVGPERAERMNPCRSAGELGVPWTIHSDAPVTPLGPLHVAWCAVNRLTASGRRLGEHERIPVADALHAITLGAAFTLKLDGELGSIECGKRADFAVLEDDPLAVPPERL